MSEKIEPALSAEEWNHPVDEFGQTLRCFDNGRVMVKTSSDDIAVNWDGAVYDQEMQKLGPARHAVIALINDSLPDTDPRKITRADVELLNRCADGDGTYEEDVKPLRSVAARLAALLPPER